MKILLTAVNAKYIHSNPAVYCLKAYAEKEGVSADIREFTINQTSETILRQLYIEKPDILIFSCYIWNIDVVCEVGRAIGKLLPRIPIWVGGPEVSYDAAAFLKRERWATGVMRGEGEQTFSELMQAYMAGKTPDEVSGITFRKGRKILSTPDRPVMDLSLVPFVYRDLSSFEHRIIYYESSRGCPFSCSYCLSSIDKKLRFRSLELVFEELQFFLDHKVPQVKFVDRTFNCRHEHALAIWRFIHEHDNGITNFHFEVAADLLNEEEIALLSTMRPGLVQLEIGVQSTNPTTIQEIHRRMDLDKVRDITGQIRKCRNIHQHLDLIAGLPYEDLEIFKRSFNQVFAMAPDQLQLGFLKVLKGSYMYEHAGEYDCVYLDREPYEVLSTRWMDYADIIRLKRVEEMVEVYYNSAQFVRTLPQCIACFSDAFSFFDELGSYYEDMGYLFISHTRIRRYEILLDFMRGKGHEELLSKLREWMLYDLYSRENLKSRPDWARDLKPFKEKVRAFYKKEEETHALLSDFADRDQRQLAGMTHIEIFDEIYPQRQAVLFSYEQRDPLDHSAKILPITLD